MVEVSAFPPLAQKSAAADAKDGAPGCMLGRAFSASQAHGKRGKKVLLRSLGRRQAEFLGFVFAVEFCLLGDFEQILVVGSVLDFS
jgi:hypothetical protein